MVKESAPRHGSLAFSPRKRAKSIVARIRKWPKVDFDKPRLLAFAGYKAGMTHAVVVEDNPNSPDAGKEKTHAATVVETPPLFVFGVRVYEQTPYGLKTLGEVWANNLPQHLARRLKLPKRELPVEEFFEKLNERIDRVKDVRVLVCTQPHLAGIHKKTPEVFEIKIDGGTVKDRLEYAKSILGKEVRVTDVFEEGMYVDVIAVTKGKGFQGVIKRFGVKRKHHKSRKTVREVGAIGGRTPKHVMRTVPRAGQMGFHQRTEYNKRILKIGNAQEENATPAGGWIPVSYTHLTLPTTERV